jgi:hypothetical protein
VRKTIREFTVSTVYIFDHWETCIFDDDERDSEVVDIYLSEDEAEFHHSKWCTMVESHEFTLDSVRE